MAKTRLAGQLPTPLRVRLVEAMLRHVYEVANDTQAISEVLVVCSDKRGHRWPPTTVLDDGADLNAAFAMGARLAQQRGHGAVLLLPADLALVAVDDLDSLIQHGNQSGAALAFDRTGTGTNAFYQPAELPIDLLFGPGSGPGHLAACRRAGFDPKIIERSGLKLDVDTGDDLVALRTHSEYEFLWQAQWCEQ
jgi:2-phospho-L-lactate guanylyltransferase